MTMGSIYAIDEITPGTIKAAGVNWFDNPILGSEIIKDLPDGIEGVLRLWITVDNNPSGSAAIPIAIAYDNFDGSISELLNPEGKEDNALIPPGKYRFDVDIKKGDEFNIRAVAGSVNIIKCRISLIIFGA